MRALPFQAERRRNPRRTGRALGGGALSSKRCIQAWMFSTFGADLSISIAARCRGSASPAPLSLVSSVGALSFLKSSAADINASAMSAMRSRSCCSRLREASSTEARSAATACDSASISSSQRPTLAPRFLAASSTSFPAAGSTPSTAHAKSLCIAKSSFRATLRSQWLIPSKELFRGGTAQSIPAWPTTRQR
ncbi:MAG: hypothetical protein QOC72_2174 [Methylobacteriaceae bacterium]|nr:hypothetical protein [Methylobacteriaceae bacterium]